MSQETIVIHVRKDHMLMAKMAGKWNGYQDVWDLYLTDLEGKYLKPVQNYREAFLSGNGCEETERFMKEIGGAMERHFRGHVVRFRAWKEGPGVVTLCGSTERELLEKYGVTLVAVGARLVPARFP